MKIIKTKFKGLVLFKNKNFFDTRGLLREIYKKKIQQKNIIFDYFSISKKNVIRGLHFQFPQQEKIITVIKGTIIDYCLDLRRNSKTFLQVYKTHLSQKNGKSIFVPKGFAHGFISLESENILLYKNSTYYSPNNENSINIFDKDLKIIKYKNSYKLSKKDLEGLSLNDFLNKYKTL